MSLAHRDFCIFSELFENIIYVEEQYSEIVAQFVDAIFFQIDEMLPIFTYEKLSKTHFLCSQLCC